METPVKPAEYGQAWKLDRTMDGCGWDFITLGEMATQKQSRCLACTFVPVVAMWK